jgi:hypothetical protein
MRKDVGILRLSDNLRARQLEAGEQDSVNPNLGVLTWGSRGEYVFPLRTVE